MQNQKFQIEVDPDEDTEWNDILREKGVIPEKPKSPTEELEEALAEVIENRHLNRLENLNLNELDELEDEEDDEFLEIYKQRRLDELKKLQSNEKFGNVYPVSKPEWSKEITEASKTSWVFVHLSSQSVLQSRILSSIWLQLASIFKDIKFCDIEGKRAIENYPDSNCPTIIIYKDGDVVKQYVGLAMLNGNDTSLKDLERVLVEVDAVKEFDARLSINQQQDDDLEESHKLRFQKKSIREENSDDDDFFD